MTFSSARRVEAEIAHRRAAWSQPGWNADGSACANSADWLVDLLAPMAVRRHLPAAATLFEVGDRAGHYYLVESGRLVLERKPARGATVLRIAEPRQLLIVDCAGTHVATCRALSPVSILAVDRRNVELKALLDPTVRGVLNAVHASELGMILQSLGVEHRTNTTEAEARRRRPPMPRRSLSRGRWQPYLAFGSAAG
ncbi:MAG: cyclic nucleotide-binding domain-containing protein [Hyphomicrobiaceae bacterium]